MYDRLTASRAQREGTLLVLPLHSSVSPAEQRRVFERPPAHVRKVVLATNIAETSLTIEDVVYVVDSGKLKVWSLVSAELAMRCHLVIAAGSFLAAFQASVAGDDGGWEGGLEVLCARLYSR